MKKAGSLLLFILGLISCVSFFYFKSGQYGLIALLISKLMPSVAMCVWLSINIKTNENSILVLIGLICSLMCDLFMELPNGSYQILGIVSNMGGLVFYTLYFVQGCKIRDYFGVVPVAIVIFAVFSVIAPNLNSLFIPVLLYCALFTVFMWRSMARLQDPGIAITSKQLGVLGSICLVCSDSLLSFQMFSILRNSFIYVILIMMLWWTGLFLLAVTAGIKERNTRASA